MRLKIQHKEVPMSYFLTLPKDLHKSFLSYTRTEGVPRQKPKSKISNHQSKQYKG